MGSVDDEGGGHTFSGTPCINCLETVFCPRLEHLMDSMKKTLKLMLSEIHIFITSLSYVTKILYID